MKGDKLLKLLVSILIITVFLLIGYIVYDSVKDNKEQPVTSEEKQEEKTNNVLIDDVKISYNKEIDQKLTRPIIEMLNYSLDNIKYDTNLLSTKSSKIKFLGSLILTLDKGEVKTQMDIDINGQEVTGGIAINTEDFISKYSNLFGETITLADIISTGDYEEKDGWLYGTYATGMPTLFILKVTSFNQNETSSDYILSLDFISSNDYEEIMEYDKANVLNYPTDKVTAKININLTKQSNGSYQIKGLNFTK